MYLYFWISLIISLLGDTRINFSDRGRGFQPRHDATPFVPQQQGDNWDSCLNFLLLHLFYLPTWTELYLLRATLITWYLFAKQILIVVLSQVDDPKGVTIRDRMVVTFRPKTALIQREKAERRAVIRGTAPKECRTARIRATKEAVKGSLKARMLVNSQTQF